MERRRTNRWTGATGSDFCIKRDPAKVLGSAVARSTPPFCGSDRYDQNSSSTALFSVHWMFVSNRPPQSIDSSVSGKCVSKSYVC